MSGRSSPWKHDFLFLPEHEPLVSAGNRLLSDSPQRKVPVIFLHGRPGIGKSHFLHAFMESRSVVNQATQPQILSASTFCELVTETATGKKAKTKLDNVAKTDLLICEDIEAFSERFSAQNVFIHLFDKIVRSGGKIVLTAKCTPGDIRHLAPRFSNRCRWGGVYRLDAPSKEGREKLAVYFSELKRLKFDNDGLKFLVGNSPTTPRTLLATVEQLEHYRKVKKIATLSPSDIRDIIDRNSREALDISLAKISKEVARQFDLTSAQLRSRHQNQNSVLPRQCAMYLARELTDKTLNTIGKYFGNRSHSTVIHAWKHVGKIRNIEQELNSLLSRLQILLTGIS